MSKALVVLSGGQDSVTCLGVAIKDHGPENVECVGFVYGQRHSIEIDQARTICDGLGLQFHSFSIPALTELADSALVETASDISAKHHRKSNLPASFVPNRNALFLTIAHALAQKIGADHVYTGVCQTDYSGYPDCRQAFIDSLEMALNIGYETNITIHTPLMYLTKAETFRLAENSEILDVVLEHSHTCYNGVRDKRHEWGYGCGECPACKLRAQGWEQYVNG